MPDVKVAGTPDERRVRSAHAAVPLLLALALLSACHKKPGGQVIAVVNSDEITQPEVRAEADAEGVPPDQDLQTLAPAILDHVIQRDLLADYARRQGLDRGPEFVTRRRQVEESLLANLALRRIALSQPAPSAADVQAFIAQNPALFGQRQRLTIDQVRFATPADPQQIKSLTALHSLDAVIAKLTADGVKMARGKSGIDTGTLDPAVAAQIVALKPGDVFDLSTHGVTMIGTIVDRTPVAGAPDSWTPVATNLLRRQRAEKAVTDAMAKLRHDAKITYDPAFKPVAPAGAAHP